MGGVAELIGINDEASQHLMRQYCDKCAFPAPHPRYNIPFEALSIFSKKYIFKSDLNDE